MSDAPREGTPAAALIHALTLSKGEPITETRVAELTRLRVAAVSQSMFDAVVGGWLTRRRNLAGSIVYGPGPKLCEQLGIAPPAQPPAAPTPAPVAPAPAAKPTTIAQAGDALVKAQADLKAAQVERFGSKPEAATAAAEATGVRMSKTARAARPMSQVGLSQTDPPPFPAGQRKLSECVSALSFVQFQFALAMELQGPAALERGRALATRMSGPILTAEDWSAICEHAPAMADRVARAMKYLGASDLRKAVHDGVRLSMSAVIQHATEAQAPVEAPPTGPSVTVRELVKPFVTEAVPKPASKKPRRAGPPLPELDVDAIPVVRMGPVDGRQSPKDGKWQALFDKLAAAPITGDGFPTMELPAAYAKTLQSYGYKLMKAKPDGPKFKISELGSKCILQRVG